MPSKGEGFLSQLNNNSIAITCVGGECEMDAIPDIGFAAGEVYFCGIDKPTDLLSLRKKVNKKDDILLMALGWLAREGKIEITSDKGKVLVRKIN